MFRTKCVLDMWTTLPGLVERAKFLMSLFHRKFFTSVPLPLANPLRSEAYFIEGKRLICRIMISFLFTQAFFLILLND